MKRLRFILVILLAASIVSVPGQSVLSTPDEYAPLGDFYLKQNLREQAINAYKKALEIDPKFEHAKEMLKKLND